MRRILRVFAWLVVLIAGLPLLAVGAYIAWTWLNTAHVRWHQRMELVIETPTGEIRGAAVQEARLTATRGELRHIMGVNGATAGYGFKGEAVVVEVAPGRWLFALLKGGEGDLGSPGLNLATLAGRPQRLYPATEAAAAAVKALPKDQPLPLTPDLYPLMVTFDDISDPKSVRQVDPADLAATFGPGVALKAVTLAVTDAPVTEGKVEGVLGDLAAMGRRVDPATRIQYPPGFPEAKIPTDAKYFDVSSFKTGLYK